MFEGVWVGGRSDPSDVIFVPSLQEESSLCSGLENYRSLSPPSAMATYVDEENNGYPGPKQQQLHPERHPVVQHHIAIANPAPLGLMAFALTTFVLSCYNAGIFGIQVTSPTNVVTGLALFYGGIAQLLAGMWEFKTGNTFGATAFASYGAFWLSYAVILIPSFGVTSAYTAPHDKNLGPALAIFLLGWTIFTLLMWFGTLRANAVLSALFFCLTITFLLLSISEWKGATVSGHRVKRAGGFLGIFTAFIAWYLGLAGLLTKDNFFFTLPVGHLKRH